MKVLMLVADGLNAGAVGCYGNEWNETPTLDRLAAEGIVFDNHIADHLDPARARQVWDTGCYLFADPNQTTPERPLPRPSIWGCLDELRITAVLIQDHPIPESTLSPRLYLENAHERIKAAVDRVVPLDRWFIRIDLAALRDAPEILTEAKAVEPEADQGEPELEAWQDQRAAAVHLFDSWLGLLVEDLAQRRLLDEITLIVTSVRGQACESSRRLGEELIHLPLLIRLPQAREAGRRVAALTQPVDLPITVFDLFGLPRPPADGQSLLPLIHGDIDQLRPFACAELRSGEVLEWALRSPEWGLFLTVDGATCEILGKPRLHIKPDDRWEVNDLYQHHQELADELVQELLRFRQTARGGTGP